MHRARTKAAADAAAMRTRTKLIAVTYENSIGRYFSLFLHSAYQGNYPAMILIYAAITINSLARSFGHHNLSQTELIPTTWNKASGFLSFFLSSGSCNEISSKKKSLCYFGRLLDRY